MVSNDDTNKLVVKELPPLDESRGLQPFTSWQFVDHALLILVPAHMSCAFDRQLELVALTRPAQTTGNVLLLSEEVCLGIDVLHLCQVLFLKVPTIKGKQLYIIS